MERQELAEKLHELEKRLNDLEAGFGGLKRASLTLEATLQALTERGLLPREVIHRFNQAFEPQRDRFGQYADEVLQQFVYSLLDVLMESLDRKSVV